MFNATVNQHYSFSLSEEDIAQFSPDKTGEGFVFEKNGKTFNIQIAAFDEQAKSCTLIVNANAYEVQLADAFDQLVEKLGFSIAKEQKVSEIKAPMPGLVIDVIAQVGQSIAKGDPLLILEAMKMENVLKAPSDGVIREIVAKKGMAVEKNQILINLE